MTLLGCSVTLFSQELYVDVWTVCFYNTRAEAESSEVASCRYAVMSVRVRLAGTPCREQLDQDADVLTLVFLSLLCSNLEVV